MLYNNLDGKSCKLYKSEQLKKMFSIYRMSLFVFYLTFKYFQLVTNVKFHYIFLFLNIEDFTQSEALTSIIFLS